jgi:hypothetical protein
MGSQKTKSVPRSRGYAISKTRIFQLFFFCLSFFVFYLKIEFLVWSRESLSSVSKHTTVQSSCGIHCRSAGSEIFSSKLSLPIHVWSNSWLDPKSPLSSFINKHPSLPTVYQSTTHTREQIVTMDANEELMTERIATTRVSLQRRNLNATVVVHSRRADFAGRKSTENSINAAMNAATSRIAQLLDSHQLHITNAKITGTQKMDGHCLLLSSAVKGLALRP